VTSASPVNSSVRWAPWLVFALAAIVYAGAVFDGVVRDDYFIVTTNPLVTGRSSPWLILVSHYWAGVREEADLYRPFTIGTYWLNARLFGMGPWSFHLVNILLHGAVTALVFLLGRRLAGSAAAALAAGILFAVHPALSEAVIPVVGRADLLAALFVLGAWLSRERPGRAALLFACGLLCKENAVVLPGLYLAEDLLNGRRLRESARDYGACAAVLGVFLAIRMAVIGGVQAGAVSTYFEGVPFSHRVLTAVEVLGRYAFLLFYPVHLSADYSYNQIPVVASPADPGFVAGCVAIASAGAIAFLCRKRLPGVTLGILLFAIAIVPVSNIPFPVGEIMAERFLYLPGAGFCLACGAAIAWILATLGVRRAVAGAATAAAIPGLLLAARTWERVGDWKDPLSFCEATQRASPGSAKVQGNCALVYQSLGRLDEAEASYLRALRIDPDDAGAHFGLGTLYEGRGRLPEAVSEYEISARLQPDDPMTLNNLGRALLAERRAREAIEVLTRAVAANPASPMPAVNLAAAWLAAGDPGRAESILGNVLRAHPDDAAAKRVREALESRRNRRP